MTEDFTPVLYVKSGCPHCFKTRLFLLEAGVIDRFALREFTPGDAREDAIRVELAPHFAKPTFPTVQYAQGAFQNESDAIIARYAAQFAVDPAPLPLYQIWIGTLHPKMRELRAENLELKAQAAAQPARG